MQESGGLFHRRFSRNRRRDRLPAGMALLSKGSGLILRASPPLTISAGERKYLPLFTDRASEPCIESKQDVLRQPGPLERHLSCILNMRSQRLVTGGNQQELQG